MKTYLRNLFESVSQSLWLMPAFAIACAMASSYLMLAWEQGDNSSWSNFPFIYHSGRDASLAIVGTIVGSLMTVAGVTFSITIVSLTLASSQFGPRLLRNFLRSRPSQVTLGALVGSFVYGILIMTGMDEGWESGEAHPSVTLMIILACVCVCLIVYYIHHVAISIQADELVASVYRELEYEIDKLPDRKDEAEEDESLPKDWGAPEVECKAGRSGYLTAIDCDGLVGWAEEREGKIRLLRRPGQFVTRGEVLAQGYGFQDDEAAFRRELEDSLFVKGKRTPEQDIEFLIDQLVEVALRAISPGINDPNTAIVCIDYLAAALFQLKNKTLPSRCSFDSGGDLRLFVPYTDFDGFINESFDQLRQSGAAYPDIVIRIVSSLSKLADALTSNDPRKHSLSVQVDQIEESVNGNDKLTTKDREDIAKRIDGFRNAHPSV